MTTKTLLAFAALTPLALLAQTPPAPVPDPSLTPPGAPANNVFKTLDQVEPRIPLTQTTAPGDADSLFRITRSGSYYLTNNIQGVADKNGIEIAADNVTLDLNGFSVQGAAETLSGIRTDGDRLGTSILNGSVKDWELHGIYVFPASVNSLVSSVRVQGNGGSGIVLRGIAKDCIATGNQGTGPAIYVIGHVIDCRSLNNSGTGIENGLGTVSGCSAFANGGAGFKVSGSVTERCGAFANMQAGFIVHSNSVLRNCSAFENNSDDESKAAGIRVPSAARNVKIEGNSANGNDTGIEVLSAARNTIVRNTALGNDTDYVIAAGNIVGTIVKTTTAAAISGNSGGGSGTTDPFANFAD